MLLDDRRAHELVGERAGGGDSLKAFSSAMSSGHANVDTNYSNLWPLFLAGRVLMQLLGNKSPSSVGKGRHSMEIGDE